MGCFLGCFGKDRRRRNLRKTPNPGGQKRHGGQNHLQIQTVVPTEEDIKCSPPKNLITDLCDSRPEEPLSSGSKKKVTDLCDSRPEEPLSSGSKKKVTDLCESKPVELLSSDSKGKVTDLCDNKTEEPLSSNFKKKVTFDSNVTTYEHVSVVESVDSLLVPELKEKEGSGVVLPSDSRSTSEDDSVSSSVGSYPPNHRYLNCRDSDDEDMDYSDLEDQEDYDDEEDYSDEDDEQSMESRTGNVEDHQPILDEVDSPMELPFRLNQDLKKTGPYGYARNRNDYVQQVLNPIENLSQWKTVKSKKSSQFNLDKENSTAADLSPIPFSSEPTFKPKSEGKKNSNQEIAVDASLSTWLTDSGPSPAKTTSHGSLETVTQDMARTFEDRPILGALTVEELKQMSASSSPRKSPSRSPDDMYIIGSVGTYWNESVSSKESRSGSSFKGIPNTTSKYREDKRVNWHSTPFETRLERALNGKAGGI